MDADPERKPLAALVTGGARRIGRGIVEGLAADGHAVAIHCHRSAAEAETLAYTIRRSGGRAAVVTGDLSDTAALAGLVARAEAEIGSIGLLVNNASLFEADEVPTLAPESLMAHLSVNLAAPCLLAAAVAARRPANAGGIIINIIDQRVLKPTPQFFSYSLSKAGLWWATRTMAQALAPHFRVVGIGPGPTMQSARQEPSDFARQAAAVPMGRGPSLDELSRTIRWIIATPSLTGQLIALDGGQHLAWQTPDVIGVGE